MCCKMNIFCVILCFLSLTIYPMMAIERVIGGSPANVHSAPYQVSLQNIGGNHVCGGAIISKKAIISAAHCFVSAEPENIYIVVGTIDLSIKEHVYNTSKIITHYGYNNITKGNDIAILFTNRSIVFSSFIKPLSIYSKFMNSGEILNFTGFGVTNISESDKSSELLQIINLRVFDMETCQYAYRNIRELFESQICTFTTKDEGTCYGDSGGPLVFDSGLVGISSFGVPCAVGFPDVFTRASSYVTWIKEHVPDVQISSASKLYADLMLYTFVISILTTICNIYTQTYL